jgi:hypothetical protein
MSTPTKSLDRAPLLQQIQEQLKAKMDTPIMASSPVVREIQAKRDTRRA